MPGQAVPNPAGCPPGPRCAACPYGTLLDGGDVQAGFQYQQPGAPCSHGGPQFSGNVQFPGGPTFNGGFQAHIPVPQFQFPQPQVHWQAPPQAAYQAPQPQWQQPAPPPVQQAPPAQGGYNPNINPYGAGMQVMQAKTMHWAQSLALKGGWGIILLLVLYWGNEWWAGRWPAKKAGNDIVATAPANNAPTTYPAPDTTSPPANTTSNASGFDKGDGNYMYRMDHTNRIIQLGRIPLDASARQQLVAWRAEGYMDVAWSNESSVLAAQAPGTTVVRREVPAELLDTLRRLANETDSMRRDLEQQYPNRFTDSEAIQVNGASNSIKSLADRALGIAQGAGSQ